MTAKTGPECEDPFRIVLRLASDRVFAGPVDLATFLDATPADTMYRLSVELETFAPLRDVNSAEESRLNHQHLLTAARAYVVARRKLTADAIDQGELPLVSVEPGP